MTNTTENEAETVIIEDPLERMLKKTGCMQLHYQVQECIAETQDWRQCQVQLQRFKDCMIEYKKKEEER